MQTIKPIPSPPVGRTLYYNAHDRRPPKSVKPYPAYSRLFTPTVNKQNVQFVSHALAELYTTMRMTDAYLNQSDYTLRLHDCSASIVNKQNTQCTSRAFRKSLSVTVATYQGNGSGLRNMAWNPYITKGWLSVRTSVVTGQ
jgi:hypothetical protein